MTTKKVMKILEIAYSSEYSYAEVLPEYYLSRNDFIKKVEWFSSIKDFSKVRGLKKAFEELMVEIYGDDWREEYKYDLSKESMGYESYYQLCQREANKFMRTLCK